MQITLVEELVSYIAEPMKASGIWNCLVKHPLSELLAKPHKVMFPKGNAR